MIAAEQMREENLAFLNKHGFKPATWMPLPNAVGASSDEIGFAGGVLRSDLDIANRLLCHFAVFAWAAAPSEFEQPVSDFIATNSLRNSMTEDELRIIDMPKDKAMDDYASVVGWRLENMWALAWIIGVMDKPSATTGQISPETSDALMALFLPDLTATAQSLLAQGELQAVEAVVQMEDLFYLAHNAVRAGQTGSSGQLPDGFDPFSDGGAIHERRHSLTWSLAPGADWDETDLST